MKRFEQVRVIYHTQLSQPVSQSVSQSVSQWSMISQSVSQFWSKKKRVSDGEHRKPKIAFFCGWMQSANSRCVNVTRKVRKALQFQLFPSWHGLRHILSKSFFPPSLGRVLQYFGRQHKDDRQWQLDWTKMPNKRLII